MVNLMNDATKFSIPGMDIVNKKYIFSDLNVPKLSENIQFTQVSMAKYYWSKIHVDDDFSHTLLTAWNISYSNENKNDILQYFVFPTYNVCVPLRHGDILVFNPLVLHGCTSPLHEQCCLLSAYVSAKTVIADVSSKVENEL